MDAGTREALDLLKEVILYNMGEGKYNFSEIHDDYEKENARFDAWSDIQNRIEIFLVINGQL